jgi:hypothetical protein
MRNELSTPNKRACKLHASDCGHDPRFDEQPGIAISGGREAEARGVLRLVSSSELELLGSVVRVCGLSVLAWGGTRDVF